jgi:hypothetical protein
MSKYLLLLNLRELRALRGSTDWIYDIVNILKITARF